MDDDAKRERARLLKYARIKERRKSGAVKAAKELRKIHLRNFGEIDEKRIQSCLAFDKWKFRKKE